MRVNYLTEGINLFSQGFPAGRVSLFGALVLVLLMSLSTGCRDQFVQTETTSLTSSCTVDTLKVGDLFYLSLEGQWPDTLSNVHLAWSANPDTLLIAGGDSTNVEVREGWIGRRYRLGVVATREGEYDLPPLRLLSGTDETIASSESYHLIVSGQLDPESQPELKPLADMASLKDFPWRLAIILALVLLTLLAALIIWRRHFRSREVESLPPPIPPGIEFRDGISSLVEQRLPESGQMRQYTQELSWIFRRYLGRRWEQRALEATRPEIMRWLPGTKLEVKEQQIITQWLELTDSVKFAGRIPLLDETASLLTQAQQVVRRSEEISAEEERLRLQALEEIETTGKSDGEELS